MFLPSLLSLFLIPLIHLPSTLAQPGSAPSQNFFGSTPTQRRIINSTQASSIISAAEAEASSANLPSNIAVTDAYGSLVAFLKTDNAILVSTDISIKKAKTVTLFNGQYTTAGLYNVSQPGNALYGIEETNGGMVVFGGGLPIFLDGYFIGAVGVSGGTVDQDVQVAAAGLNALGAAVPDFVIKQTNYTLVTGQ